MFFIYNLTCWECARFMILFQWIKFMPESMPRLTIRKKLYIFFFYCLIYNMYHESETRQIRIVYKKHNTYTNTRGHLQKNKIFYRNVLSWNQMKNNLSRTGDLNFQFKYSEFRRTFFFAWWTQMFLNEIDHWI